MKVRLGQTLKAYPRVYLFTNTSHNHGINHLSLLRSCLHGYFSCAGAFPTCFQIGNGDVRRLPARKCRFCDRGGVPGRRIRIMRPRCGESNQTGAVGRSVRPPRRTGSVRSRSVRAATSGHRARQPAWVRTLPGCHSAVVLRYARIFGAACVLERPLAGPVICTVIDPTPAPDSCKRLPSIHGQQWRRRQSGCARDPGRSDGLWLAYRGPRIARADGRHGWRGCVSEARRAFHQRRERPEASEM